jgi:hypothetical protein
MTPKRVAVALGSIAFLWSAFVYLRTLTPTVPFWDSGEFIAVSYILGIPHPPGTPFYVLLGRLATMVPWATIAQRVNAVSAIASALTVMITFFTGLRLIRLAQGKNRSRTDEWLAMIGALTGAMLLAFSDSFWENSIEAEVYSLMSLAQILVLWLGLKWWEAHEQKPTAGPLLVAVYVMWLCVGLHLGVGMMGLPLIVLAWLVDRRVALVFAMPLLSVLFVVMGLERMAGATLGLSVIVFVSLAWQKKLEGWVAAAASAAAILGMVVGFGDKDFTPGTALIAAAAVLVPVILLAMRSREGKILALALLLMATGYSTHLYLPIRAAQHPAINEGNPSNWERLRDLLERKQYGSTSMLERRAPWSVQLGKEFWRYFGRQWPLFPGATNTWSSLLPLLLGLLGAVWQARRERTSFLVTFVFVGLTTAGMIVFLNFTDHEVRERDYFFQSGYHAYALWIALGATWLIQWVRDSFRAEGAKRLATGATAALMLVQPMLLMKNLWFTHDRHGNYVAHDYAYNMLVPLADSSFVVTNGDNDTFPLWYMQQVENFRKDVRVVNLSLLNTDWYIFQLRDEEPKIPITLDDDVIRMAGQGAFQDARGNIIYTNRFMIDHIIEVDRKPDGSWIKQPYFAVTVPEHMGLDKHFTLEGLVYRVQPDTLHSDIDLEATRHNMYDVFKYRGLFFADGSWDSTVYKDENASTLSRNYAAAHLQLAFEYEKSHELPKAIAELERVERMFPGYVDVLVPLGKFYMEAHDTVRAQRLFERLVAYNPQDSEAHYYYGVTLMFMHQMASALREFDRAIELNPGNFYAYVAAYSMLHDSGRRQEAQNYLRRWVSLHPEDAETRRMLEGEVPGQVPLPVTPPTNP